MSTEGGHEYSVQDYRLADFKLLLPLGKGVRVLVTELRVDAFLGHLAREVGSIDRVSCQPTTEKRGGEPDPSGRERSLAQPEGLYDLILTNNPRVSQHLGPGGILCLFFDHPPEAAPDGLTLIGRWRAYPGWPAFRVLIPDHPAGWRSAVQSFRIFPSRSMAGLSTRILPGLARWFAPSCGIAIYQRADTGQTQVDNTLSLLDRSLCASQHSEWPGFNPAAWMLVSGRLGEGNPILAFNMDAKGYPRRLLKASRYAEGQHLALEAAQLRQIEEALGPRLGERVIRPTASAQVDGRWTLAYEFVPTSPFHGLRWRLQGRARFCMTMAEWLAQVGCMTRRQDSIEAIHQHHLQPLDRLLGRKVLPPEAHAMAQAAYQRLERQSERIPTILEHGDLGIYNIRLTAADGSDFRVIDWGSSTFDGMPLGDLAYLLTSARAPTSLAVQCFHRYLQIMGLEVTDAFGLWCCYLSRRWEELDQIRPVDPNDPTSGGGILLPVHAQVSEYLWEMAHTP